MANALAWLLGREDRTGEPPPVSVAGPELRNYYPSPSERFGNWISDALGAGPGASVVRQNFAKGVPSVMSLFPPLGIGLSAADVAHAKAAGDPMGAAAAAIGMVPGAGKLAPEARGLAKGGEDAASQMIKQIEEALYGPSAGSSFIPPKPVAIPGTNPALAKGGDPNAALAAIEEVLGKQVPAGTRVDPLEKYKQAYLEGKLTFPEYEEFARTLGQPKPFPAQKDLATVNEIFKKKAAPTVELSNYEVSPGVFAPNANPAPQVISQTSGFTKHPNYEWAQLKNGGYEIYDNKTASTVAHVNTLEEAANYKGPAAAPKPFFDYEKDDTGLYHIFDATTGKTHAVVDNQLQAKQWIEEQKTAAPSAPPQTIPITEHLSTPWQAKDTGNSQYFGDLGIFPQEVPFKLPERALAQGYVTPAVHGTVSSEWSTPAGSGIGEIGDALRLPSDELGVHFGTPDQARHFTGREAGEGYLPRTYPTALQTGKSIELPDMGTWGVKRMREGLRHLNSGGEIPAGSSNRFPIQNAKAHIGEFPAEELSGIKDIEGMRNYLQKKGYDSVNYINAVEGPGQRSHIMFKPSPESSDYVQGVRSPFAAFAPSKMLRPELGLGIMGMLGLGAAVKPSPSEAASKGTAR